MMRAARAPQPRLVRWGGLRAACLGSLSVVIGPLVGCDDGRGEQLEQARSEIGSLRAEVESLRDQLEETEARVAKIEKLAAANARAASRDAATRRNDAAPPSAGALDVLERAEAGDLSCPKEGECKITREFLEELLENPKSLMDQARMVPGRKDGGPYGFKVFAIRGDTVLALLGFKNGDTVLSVNGHSMNSPDEALEAYAALRTADTKKLTFAIERRGEPATIEVGLKGE